MFRAFARLAALITLSCAAPALAATEPVNDLGSGLVGVYYPPAKAGAPLVMVLGGSEGGFQGSGAMAKTLSDEGFGALALAYFKAPGLPAQLEEIPLETFTRGLDFLAARPETGRRRVVILGVSKGAEASLIVAARDRRACGVLAAVPSSVAWQGVNMTNFASGKGSWTWGGQAIPFAPYDFSSVRSPGLRGIYEGSLAKAPAEAAIPVEKIGGPILLISGGKDALWPSTPMAEAIMARLAAAKFRPAYVHLPYPEAGHAAFGKPWADEKLPAGPQLAQAGGTPEGNQGARKDGWPKALAFLRETAAGRGCAPLRK
jgi:uncharacterized protein